MRKDVERVFGMMKKKFRILRHAFEFEGKVCECVYVCASAFLRTAEVSVCVCANVCMCVCVCVCVCVRVCV